MQCATNEGREEALSAVTATGPRRDKEKGGEVEGGGRRNNPGNSGRQDSEWGVHQKSSASALCLNYTSSLSASRLAVSEETLCCGCVLRVRSHRRGSVCESSVCAVVFSRSGPPPSADLRVNKAQPNIPSHYFPQQRRHNDQVSTNLKSLTLSVD